MKILKRHVILLITEILFDYLIAIVSVKAAEIGMSEVAKKLDTSALPQSTSRRQITQRAKLGFNLNLKNAGRSLNK